MLKNVCTSFTLLWMPPKGSSFFILAIAYEERTWFIHDFLLICPSKCLYTSGNAAMYNVYVRSIFVCIRFDCRNLRLYCGTNDSSSTLAIKITILPRGENNSKYDNFGLLFSSTNILLKIYFREFNNM